MHSFLGLISPGNLPFPAQGHTHLQHCFRLRSNRGSKAAKRLGDFLQTERGLRLCQSWEARAHHPFSPQHPKSFPEGPLVIVSVLGRPSLEESYPSLANGSCTGGQGEVKWAEAVLLSGRYFVSLVAWGPKVSHSALAMGGYSFWNQAEQFPTHYTAYFFDTQSVIVHDSKTSWPECFIRSQALMWVWLKYQVLYNLALESWCLIVSSSYEIFVFLPQKFHTGCSFYLKDVISWTLFVLFLNSIYK